MHIFGYFHNDFEDELDNEFLDRYNKARTTVDLDEGGMFIDDEEDGYDNYEEYLQDIEEETNSGLAIIDTSLSSKRLKRKLYQRKYRAGLIPAKKAQGFTRKCDNSSRKKLTYYITPSLIEQMNIAILDKNCTRRVFCSEALENYLKNPIPVNNTNTHLKKQFMFDEISSELWDRIDQYCRDSSGKKTIRMYQVVEAAITLALKKD